MVLVYFGFQIFKLINGDDMHKVAMHNIGQSDHAYICEWRGDNLEMTKLRQCNAMSSHNQIDPRFQFYIGLKMQKGSCKIN